MWHVPHLDVRPVGLPLFSFFSSDNRTIAIKMASATLDAVSSNSVNLKNTARKVGYVARATFLIRIWPIPVIT